MPQSIVTLIAGFFGGGIVASVVTHRLTLNREARDRRIDFRGFLGRWLDKIQKSDTNDPKTVFAAYSEWTEHLWGYYAKLGKNFIFRRKFKKLCTNLGSVTQREIEEYQGNRTKLITEKIHKLLEFL